jgi:hypothetical protein
LIKDTKHGILVVFEKFFEILKEKKIMKCLAIRVFSFVLIVAVYAFVSSAAVFAGSGKVLGEIKVFGNSVNPSVKVNGELVQSGQLLFPNSVIATDADSYAIINVGDLGRLELAPNTLFTISFNEKELNGELSAGKITVLEGSNVKVKTPNGEVATLNSGESATTQQTTNQDDDDNKLLLFALILGGVAAAIIIAATRSNDIELGGGATVASPTR